MSDADADRSEQLDEDVIGGGAYPPDRPLGVGERLTPEEEQVGDSMARRMAREEPEVGERPPRADPAIVRSVGPLVGSGDEDVEGADVEGQEVAHESRNLDEMGWDATQAKEAALPAEEAAMHLTEPPPMGDGDGYVDGDDD